MPAIYKKIIIALSISILALSISAQASTHQTTANPAHLNHTLVDNNNKTALTLITERNTDNPKYNHLYSPYGLINLLGMIQNGISQPEKPQLYRYFGWSTKNKVNQQIAQQNKHFRQSDKKVSTQFDTTFGIWLDNQHTLLPSFKKLVQPYGDDLIHLAPLTKNPAHSAQLINTWVSAGTGQSIGQMFSADMIKGRKLILINTNFFKAKWRYPFEARLARNAPFYNPDKKTTVRFMHKNLSAAFYKNQQWQIISLPYQDGEFSLTIMLPTKNKTLDDQLKNLSTNKIKQLQGKMKTTLLSLSLPTFSFSYRASLLDDLNDLKIINASQKYTAIMKNTPLEISDIIQQTKIDVDEEGTTAASATSGMMVPTSFMEKPPAISMTVDHPFLFFIHDRKGLIIYIGLINHLADATQKKTTNIQ